MLGPIPSVCPACKNKGGLHAACVACGIQTVTKAQTEPACRLERFSAARLVAACPCEEHDYCDEACLCRGAAKLHPAIEDPEPQAVNR